jgi:hypothetical protein
VEWRDWAHLQSGSAHQTPAAGPSPQKDGQGTERVRGAVETRLNHNQVQRARHMLTCKGSKESRQRGCMGQQRVNHNGKAHTAVWGHDETAGADERR